MNIFVSTLGAALFPGYNPEMPRGLHVDCRFQTEATKTSEGPGKFGSWMFTRFAIKGAELFLTFCLSLEVNVFLSQLKTHFLQQFVSFKLVCASRNKFSCEDEFFFCSPVVQHGRLSKIS
jgi:hypothetical protein